MATEKVQTPGSRLALLTGVMGLAVTAALALARVFDGGGTALRLAVAAAAAVLLAAAFERRHVLLATLASLAGLLLAIGLLVFPSTTWFGLPLGSTFHEVTRSLHQVGQAAATEVAPAFPRPSLVLAAVTASWAAAFSCHALAVRARSPFQALFPPAALLGFANLILSDAGRPLEVIAFLASALAVLFADGTWRVGQWGTVTAWTTNVHEWQGQSGTGRWVGGRSARRVGVACLAIALLTPWILPGFRAQGLVTTKSKPRGSGVTVDPFVDIRPQLQLQKPIQLFHVRSRLAAYWRLLSLDSFDGEVWRASNPDATNGVVLRAGQLPVSGAASPYQTISQEVTIDWPFGSYLPAAFEPAQIALPADVRYDYAASMLVDPGGVDRGFSYQVISREPVPSADQLNAFTIEALSPGNDAARYAHLPSLPPLVADRLSKIAHHLTDSQPTPYLKIIAIQDYLKTFRYDLAVAPAANGSQLLHFLTESKAGYCVQFSAAMAVLLRELGIPSRVAVGYTPGNLDPKDPTMYRVTTSDAHAWTEVLFPAYGWIPFEPTPTRSNPGASSYVFGLVSPGTGGAGTPGASQGGASGSASPGRPNPAEANSGSNSTSIDATRNPHSWRWWAFRVIILLGALMMIAIPVTKLLSRRLALSRAHRPEEIVLASYRVLASKAADIGLGRQPHETLWEYRTRLKDRVDGLDGELDRLIGLTGRAAYSNRGIQADQAGQAAGAARLASRKIRRSVSGWTRLGGLFRIDRAMLPGAESR